MSRFAWEDAPLADEAAPSAPAWASAPLADEPGAPEVTQGDRAPAWMNAPLAEQGVTDHILSGHSLLPLQQRAMVGLGETALQLGTGLGSAAAGTVAGAVEAVRQGDVNAFPKTFQDITEAGTYQPRTQEGKLLSGALAWPFEKAEELGGKAGEAVLDATGSPGAATTVHTGVAALPYAAGLALGRRRAKGEEAAVKDDAAGKTAIDDAAHEAATSPLNNLPEPTEAMKRVGNYTKGHLNVNGLDISIENPKGSTRSGVDPDGTPWSQTMQSHYGYIKRTLAKDGDNVDVFLGPKAEDPGLPVYVVDQVNPKTRAYDEPKALIGYESEQAARAGYLENYAKDWQGLGKLTATTLNDFKTWLKEGDTKKPFSSERSVGAMEAEAITPKTRLGDALDAIGEPIRKVGKEVADVTGAKSVSYLDDLAKTSPTAKELRNLIEYEEFSKTPVKPSFYERLSLKTGEFVPRLDDALDSVRGSFRRKLPEEMNAALLAALRGEKPTAKVGEATVRIRALLNDVRKYARESGLEVGFIDNYFPRVYRRKVLESDAGRAEFIKVLQKRGIEATDADMIAAKIANEDGILAIDRAAASERINPTNPQASKPFDVGRMLKQKARTDRNLETARKLAHIPDAELAPFLESNVPAILTRYVTGVVRRAEYARAFGPGEGKLNRMVRDIVKEASQGGRPVRPKEIQRIYDLADALQQSYHPILSSAGRAANNFMISYQYLRTLPLATLSSLSEPFIVIARGRPGTVPRALARAINHAVHETVRSVNRRFPKAEATKALEDIGLGLDAALAERLTASFGGEVTKFTTAFFKLNFLHQFTRFNRVLGNEAGKLMVERHLKDLARGVSDRRAAQLIRELSELGVDYRKGRKWAKSGADKADPFFETVKAAGLRFTNEVVMNPRPTNRPMWHSNPHFHLLAQLKGFQTVFGNTVLPRWYNMIAKRGAYEGTKNAAKIATAGVLMTLTAMLGNEIREIIKHGPEGNPKFKGEDPRKTVYRAIERAGFLGIFQFASDALVAHRFGSPAVAQLAGPAVSQANEIIEATGQAMEGKPRPLARQAVNAIPGASVIPSVRKDLVDAMAGEKTKQRGDSRDRGR